MIEANALRGLYAITPDRLADEPLITQVSAALPVGVKTGRVCKPQGLRTLRTGDGRPRAQENPAHPTTAGGRFPPGNGAIHPGPLFLGAPGAQR